MSENMKVNFDLARLKGQQLATALRDATALYALSKKKGQDVAADFWGAQIELLLALGLRERDEEGQSEAVAFHLKTVNGMQ